MADVLTMKLTKAQFEKKLDIQRLKGDPASYLTGSITGGGGTHVTEGFNTVCLYFDGKLIETARTSGMRNSQCCCSGSMLIWGALVDLFEEHVGRAERGSYYFRNKRWGGNFGYPAF